MTVEGDPMTETPPPYGAQSEAVAWQERPAGCGLGMAWMTCDRNEYERLKGSRLYEVRALYAQPPATIPLAAVEALVAELRAEATIHDANAVAARTSRQYAAARNLESIAFYKRQIAERIQALTKGAAR